MKSRRPQLLLAIAVLVITPLFGPTASTQQAPKRPIEVADVVAWKGLGSTVLSSDGQWFGYRLAPQEGDAEVVIKAVRSDKTLRFPIGEVPAGGGGGGRGGAAGGATSTLAFSDEGKWAAFTTYPTRQAALRLKRQRRPIQSAVTVVTPADPAGGAGGAGSRLQLHGRVSRAAEEVHPAGRRWHAERDGQSETEPLGPGHRRP